MSTFTPSTRAQSAPAWPPPPSMEFPDWTFVGNSPAAAEYSLRFPSSRPQGDSKNDVVVIHALMPKTDRKPHAVVILHYWGATDLRVERNLAQQLNRRGIAAVVMELPFHLERTPLGLRSGAGAIDPDPAKLVQIMKQAVDDVRRTFDWIESRPEFDSSQLGLAGTSLGAIVSALVSGIDSRVESGAYLLGGAEIAHVIWNSSRIVKERDAMRRNGVTESSLRGDLAEIEPANHLRSRSPKRSFVIGARYDTVVPPRSTEALIQALGNPQVIWLETGHFGGFLIEKQVHQEIAKFFAASETGAEYVAPKSIRAPTLRLGFEANAESGIQIVAGVDVWRSNARGDGFASILASPRGPQFFVGFKAEKGLSIGATLRSGSVSPGLFWSIVL